MHEGMPMPQAEHQKLSALAGRWEAEETLYPSPWGPGGKATGYMDARMALGGFFLISDYRQERDGKTSYEGHGLYSYDPKEKCWTMSWADSMGCSGVSQSKGQWTGNTLTFQSQSPMGHGRYTYIFEGPERIAFKLESSQDGKNWALFMEGRFRKK